MQFLILKSRFLAWKFKIFEFEIFDILDFSTEIDYFWRENPNNLNVRAKNCSLFNVFLKAILFTKPWFLAWKFKYMIHLRSKNSTIVSEFWSKNSNKLTRSIFPKSNFWTKISVLTHCDPSLTWASNGWVCLQNKQGSRAKGKRRYLLFWQLLCL